ARGHRLSSAELANVPSILLMIRSAHCTAEATSDSVRGLGRLSCKSSVVFRWRATRMLAMIPNTRFRPSSISFTIKPELASPEHPAAAAVFSDLTEPSGDQTSP